MGLLCGGRAIIVFPQWMSNEGVHVLHRSSIDVSHNVMVGEGRQTHTNHDRSSVFLV